MKNSCKIEVLTSEELLSAIESDATDHHIKRAATFLFEAIHDWPKRNLEEPNEFIAELRQEIGSPLSYLNIQGYHNKLDAGQDAWKMEALSSVLAMFDFERNTQYDQNVTLHEIVEKMTKHYRK